MALYICSQCGKKPSTIPTGMLKLTLPANIHFPDASETCVINEKCADFCDGCVEDLKLTVQLAIRPFLKGRAL